MSYEEFDRPVDRRGTFSLKYDFAAERGRPQGLLPLWVADMDFPAPACVRRAVAKTAEHGIFGYTEANEAYFRPVKEWFFSRFGYQSESEWIVRTPGIVFALAMAIRALTEKGDGVLIQSPVYYPFYEVIRDNDREIVENTLLLRGGRYCIDFNDFEEKIRKHKVKLFILCSPHNPVGRVWEAKELRKMGEICGKYGVYVVSDEIHCDFVFPGHRHHVFPVAVPEMASRTILCTSPGKTFNMAGLQVSNIFIKDEALRRLIRREIDRTGYSQLNQPGIAACKAAYEEGAHWQKECLSYLEGNLDTIRIRLRRDFPEAVLIEPEGTYFAWIDFRGMFEDPKELDRFIIEEAKLWLDAGHIFGKAGEGFQRIAYACQRSTLEAALDRLAEARVLRKR